jgi:CheY-like chemotaxis protein
MKKILFCLTIVSVAVFANSPVFNDIAVESEDFTMWSALFGLGIIAIIALFLSSEQMKNFKEHLKKKQESQNKISQEQDKMLSQMGENIQNIAQNTVETARKLSTSDDDLDITSDLAKVIRSENQLLSITTNLIEFLRIKSKKITIVNETLKLSNLLNDITGTLKTTNKNIELELIYEVDSNVCENLMGDTLNLSKIIVNLLSYCADKDAKEIKLNIYKNNLFNKDDNLYFLISSDVKKEIIDSTSIFNSNYNEQTQNYESLGLFISNELSSLMNGELIARNDKDGNLEFLLNIPFNENKIQEKSKIEVESKKILIIDPSYTSAKITKNICSQLKHKAKIAIPQENENDIPNFSKYDLVVIDERVFSDNIAEELKHNNTKIISLKNIFQNHKTSTNTKYADIKLIKPLIKKQLSQSINELYSQKEKQTTLKTSEEQTQLVHRQIFKDSKNINLQKFIHFKGTKVLLVEDNTINQKVFLGVLGKADMEITVANDGQEALDILNTDKTFDIVFMDINMPIMDGYSATKYIRQNPKFKELPIIALTALTSLAEIDKMFTLGMNGYLSKPLRKEQLFTVFSLFIQNISEEDRLTLDKDTNTPKQLDGLNIDLGISHASNNEIFYKEILVEFLDAYGDSGEVFKKLVNDFRFEQLRMLCIDIKGLTGSIGAEDMHKLSTEIIQMLIYKKHELIPTFVQPYIDELNKINNSINRYIS